MLLFAGVLNLLSSYLIASIAGNFLALYVAFFGFIVLNIEILSLFSGIYAHNIIILSFINLIFSFIFFKYKKAQFLKPKIDFKKIKNALLLDKALIFLTLTFLILISVSGFLAYYIPPLEPDSQTYHFLRAYMFFKNHSLSHFEINDIRAIVMPINSEIVYCWILTLKQKLCNFALLSYFSYFAVIFGIWQILSSLKYSIRKKLFTIFIFSSFASTVVEMSCLQTDIVVGALFVSAFALFLRKNYFLSSLSLALAMGVKTTAFILLIPYLIIIFSLKKDILKKYILYLALNFVIFSSYNYILNFIQYQNPISNQAAYFGHKFWGGIEGYISNLIHLSFQFFDFTGFAWGYYLNDKIFVLKYSFFDLIHIDHSLGCNFAQEQVNITTDEQVIGFGILGFLALIPSILKGFFSKKKVIVLLSSGFILSILILCGFVAYMQFSIRFVLSFVCLCAPCLVVIYNKKGLYKTLIVLFCMFYMAVIPFFISRTPFFKVFDNLLRNRFNVDKFITNCYEDKVVHVWTMTLAIKNTILQKYPNAKKIGYFKTTGSSALYLKTLFDIDFLLTSKIDEYNLKQYDLIIFEGEVQDDDVFKTAQFNYKINKKSKSVIFNDNGLNCYYTTRYNEISEKEEESTMRNCYGVFYFNKNKDFKLDYTYEFSDRDIPKTKLYFYTKSN